MIKFTKKSPLALFGMLFVSHAFGAVVPSSAAGVVKTLLPGSTQPGVVSQSLSSQQPTRLRPPTSLTAPKEQVRGSLGPQAEKIKFTLNKIILEGNHVYSSQQLAVIYQDKIHKKISIAELQAIIQNITNYYRNNGYILSRAILPPQHVHDGIVRVRVIEGYIDRVNVIGRAKGARYLLQAYGNRAAAQRPLQISVLENYLRLANEIPGMQVKAVLEPSKNNVGASDLNLAADQHTFNGYISYDNYGTLYMGPNQVTLFGALNSIFRSGDTTRATYVTTSRPKELKYFDMAYQTPVGTNGFNMTFEGNVSKTRPGLNLRLLKINGTANTYYILFQYPMWRSRLSNLSLNGGFTYLDSQTTAFDITLYTDHIRSFKIGPSYDFSDRYYGANLWSGYIEQGLNILGASNNPNATNTSRFGADGIFTKFVVQVARYQQLRPPFSLYLVANGQYAAEPLLSAEQFSFGGSQLGRGYDPAEIIGDKGASGSVEFRYDVAPGWRILQSFQPYVFYDFGVIWNIKDVLGIKTKQSATSTGIGSRFVFTKFLTGNFMISQPLTKIIAAEEVRGRGRLPRAQFSLVASIG